MTFNHLCAILAHEQLARRIQASIADYVQTIHSTNPQDLFFTLRNYNICAICFHLDEHGFQIKKELKKLQTYFPLVPVVAIDTMANIEMVRYCGELGVPYVISENELHTLKTILAKLCRRNEFSSYLQKYKNESIYNSKIVKNALDYIFENVTQIETCTDIADYLNISTTHLSREFKKHQ